MTPAYYIFIPWNRPRQIGRAAKKESQHLQSGYREGGVQDEKGSKKGARKKAGPFGLLGRTNQLRHSVEAAKRGDETPKSH